MEVISLVSAKDFVGQDVLSLYDWSREKIEYVFKVAEKMESIIVNDVPTTILADKIVAVCFYQPSTRTRTSFQSAIARLGGTIIGWESPGASRARDTARVEGEGESDKDTALMLNSYANAIVVRHDKEGGPREIAKWATIPVLNGADGSGPASEHPTQGLLDLYTIKKEFGKIDGIKIVFLGGARGRPAHSLNFGLAKFKNVKVYLCCPDDMRLRPEEEKPLKELGLDYEYVDDLKNVIKEVDVIWTSAARSALDEKYVLRASKLKGAKNSMIVMNVLPRGVGVTEDVDDTKHARYFQEAWNGVPIRMALLALVFGRAPPV